MPRNRHILRLSLVLILTVLLLAQATGANVPTAVAAAPASVYSWGTDVTGELGNGTGALASCGSIPCANGPIQTVDVGGSGTLGNIVAVSAGAGFSLALRNDGTVLAWGSDKYGKLGNGSGGETICDGEYCALSPVQVAGVGGNGVLNNVIAISAGYDHGLALRSDGSVVAWGSDGFSQLGNGSNNGSVQLAPVVVLDVTGSGALSGITAIAAGRDHSMALRGDGTVVTWGFDGNGQLGKGSRSGNFQHFPAPVVGVGGSGTLGGVVAIAASESHSLALKNDGSVVAWGSNFNGQLGNETITTKQVAPTPVKGIGGSGVLGGVTAISAGGNHSLALRNDGSVVAWGNDEYGQLGNGAGSGDQHFPVQVAKVGGGGALSGASAIAAGYSHSVALKGDGTVIAWGLDSGERLGNGPGAPDTCGQYACAVNPVQVIGPGGNGALGNISAVAAGAGHSLAVGTPTTNTSSPFGDVGTLPPATVEAINQLAARGIIRGCDQAATPPLFCPNDPTLRAQMAALIARAMGWDTEDHGNTFSDRCLPGGCIDNDLWRNVGTLQFYAVARGFGDGTYNPFDNVLHAQTISFITRAMVKKGTWTQATVDDGTIYPNIPAASGHRLDFITYTQYVGPVPGTTTTTEQFAPWDQPSTRAWFALALWQAIQGR